MIRLTEARIAKLQKMDLWALHHEHPQMFLTEHLFNAAKTAYNEKVTNTWQGPGPAPIFQKSWEDLGDRPTLFGTLSYLRDEKQQTAFLLECTLIWESNEEYLEAEHEQNRIARAAVVRSQSALATA